MGNKKLRTLEEIQEEIKEPEYEYIEKFAKISDDKKSLLLRIPQEVRRHFKIKAGQKIRFHEDKEGKLQLEMVWD